MTREGRVVLVTGGTGFLGSHVVSALAADGWRVRLAVQAPVARPDCEQAVVGPIGSQTDWRATLAGVDAVIHMAARVHRSPAVQATESEQYFETNTAGTVRLGEAAAAAGIPHLVFASTLLVHGAPSGRPLRESDPLQPATVYARSKAAAEEGLASLSARTGLPVTILRPPLIYGRGAKGNFALLARAIRARVPLPLGDVDNVRAFVAAANVASFILHRLRSSAARTEPFLVADAQVSTPAFIRLMGAAMGRRPLLVPVPAGLLGAALALAGKAQLRDSLLGSLAVDVSKAQGTGWRPAVTPEEALREALGPASDRG